MTASPRAVGKVVSGLTLDPERRENTPQRRSDRQSAETPTLLETLMACAPVGFGFVDFDFRFGRINERRAAVDGSTVAAQLGRKVPDVVPDLWPVLEPIYREVLDTTKEMLNLELSGPSAESPDRPRHWRACHYPVRVADKTIGIGPEGAAVEGGQAHA
jgi:hypothetical protein